MQTFTEEHVVDGGLVPCSWKHRLVPREECATCLVFEASSTRPNGDRPIEIVRCSPPVALA